jgi:hypothetical protein
MNAEQETWRASIEALRHAVREERQFLELVESGNLRMTTNGIDTTSDHAARARNTITELEKVICQIERERLTR